MPDPADPDAAPALAFTKAEWDAAMPRLTEDMAAFLAPYRTPVFIDHDDWGEACGSGSFLGLDERRWVLTNAHVASSRSETQNLGVRFNGEDRLLCLRGDHVQVPWPLDLALLPIGDDGWSELARDAKAIAVEQIATVHAPAPTEVLAFAGFSGERTRFAFETLLFGATTSLAREVELQPHESVDPAIHFGLTYLPDRATTVIGDQGLPKPPGLSGSTVWNTRFVEARLAGVDWTPALAQVTGVVWGWLSDQGAIVATRAEHLRSFLRAAPGALDGSAAEPVPS